MNEVLTFLNGNGWVGVAIGITLFIMGYLKGKQKAAKLVPLIVDTTIENLIKDGFVKTRKVLNKDGMWEDELLKYDEEV